LKRNEPLLIVLASGLANAALSAGTHVIDLDMREALASLVSTYRALQSGLYYNMTPDNPIAAGVEKAVQSRIAELEQFLKDKNSALRNSDVLGVLAFLQRMEIQKNNGRPKSRAFIDFLREFFPVQPPQGEPEPSSPSGLILP
jgi:hypothetical protein